jgi:hypothetical protein
MTSNNDNLLRALGFLRIGLLVLVLLNLSLPLIGMIPPFAVSGDERTIWTVLSTVVAPVMAPLLVVVILFDYVMSRVRAADSTGPQRARFVAIGRIELAAIAISLLFWVPYLMLKLNL